MPSIKWNIILSAPFAVLKVMIVGTLRSTIVLLARITLPFRLRKLTLRNGLYRAWIRTIFQFNPALFCSEPRKHGCQEVALQPTSGTSKSEVVGYIVPSTLVHNLKDKDAIIVYAHGGGYAFGHALQNLTMFHRLTRKAKALGQDIAFATVKYPLSTVAKWPAQRDPFIAMYEWLLLQGVPSSKVVFSGTSAGGNLILQSMLYIRDHSDLPQPSCAISHSAWTDISSRYVLNKGHPLHQTDFVDTRNQLTMNAMLRPPQLPYDTPEISPVLAADVSRLPPQLVFYGDAEVLLTDSTRWIKRCRDAGNRVEVHVGKGEMHTYSNGWPVGGRRTEEECDDLMLTYIITETAPPY